PAPPARPPRRRGCRLPASGPGPRPPAGPVNLLALGLRLPRHRATTAQVCAAYPFHAEAGLGPRGLYLGTNRLAGDAAFCFDPFELYTAEILTNPNMVVLGEPGCGKSAAQKCLLYRMNGVLCYPDRARRCAAVR